MLTSKESKYIDLAINLLIELSEIRCMLVKMQMDGVNKKNTNSISNYIKNRVSEYKKIFKEDEIA